MVIAEKTTHTPGPWKVDVFDTDLLTTRIVADRVTVALVTRGVDDTPDRTLGGPTFEANARLIAAAPDLLAALKNLVAYSECSVNSVDIWDAARAAIAKAEGR